MVKMIQAYFSFHPIGQGCFYTGKIRKYRSRHPEFNIVYDCGTVSDRDNLNSEILSFRESLFTNTLDVLFLSHLDEDHVNGVTNLLSNITCKNIYLPYLTPLQRLFVAFNQNPDESNDFDDFLTFLQSPHDYLFNIEGSNVENITYILGNSDKNIPSSDDSFMSETQSDSELLFNDKLELIPNDMLSSEMNRISNTNKVKFKMANNTLVIARIWEFYLYHEPAITENVTELIAEINRIYSLNILDEIDQSQLAKILNDKTKLVELRKTFRRIFKSLNNTGLIVQHKPIDYKKATYYKNNLSNAFHHYFNQRSRIFTRDSFSNYNYHNYPDWGASLLTGDICLNQIEDSLYIKNHLTNVLVFQVPHHGSEKGWDVNCLAKINNKGRTSAIINFGFGNNFGHPKPLVLSSLDEDNFDIRFCNQFESFEYKILISN